MDRFGPTLTPTPDLLKLMRMLGAIRIDFWNRITAFYASARPAKDVLDRLGMARDDGEQHLRWWIKLHQAAIGPVDTLI